MRKVISNVVIGLFLMVSLAFSEVNDEEVISVGRDALAGLIKTATVNQAINKYYDKKFLEIDKIIKAKKQSLARSIIFFKKNVNKNPKSTKKLARYLRRYKQASEAIDKALPILKIKEASKSKAILIKKYLKKVPIAEIGVELYNESNTEDNVKQFIEEYPNAKALFDESGWTNEIVSKLYNVFTSIGIFAILKANETAYEVVTRAPDPTENRDAFLKWFSTMHSYSNGDRLLGNYVMHTDGTKDLINEMPTGLRQYYRIVSTTLKSSINKEELDIIANIVKINRKTIAGEAKFSSNGLYSDIYKYSTLYNNIQLLVSKGVISGYTDGTFKPGIPLAQNEVLEITINLLYKKEFKQYIKNINNSKKDIYSFIDNEFSDVPLSRLHKHNKNITMTNFVMSELLMRIIYRKVKNTNLTNKSYADNEKLKYLKVYVGTIDNKNNWDVFSAGLKAFGVLNGTTNGKFYKDHQLTRANTVNLLARVYRFIKQRGAL